MLELSEKLKKFSAQVLGEATESTQKQWETFLQEQAKDYDRKETEYLEAGYITIQTGLKKLEKEKMTLKLKFYQMICQQFWKLLIFQDKNMDNIYR